MWRRTSLQTPPQVMGGEGCARVTSILVVVVLAEEVGNEGKEEEAADRCCIGMMIP